MVSRKRLENGFHGHRALNIPRATRSTRKGDSRRKNGEGIITCAFDLLATVADKLLLEREALTQSNTITSAWNVESASVLEPNGEMERHHKEKAVKLETFGHNLKDFPLNKNDARSQIDVKVVSKDDDDNSSGCTHPSTVFTSCRPQSPPRVVDRRIRKLLASKYWKTSPGVKDERVSAIRGKSKPTYRIDKTCYNRPRSRRNYPFKKRRYFSSISNYATGMSPSEAGKYTSFRLRDSQVKLRIKSFCVPELYIEIPETETVGSLKRRVTEAVTTLLGGGLMVGLLLHGKKVKDDNKTLLQTGISHGYHLDTLGFALEPNSSQIPPLPPLCDDDTHFTLPFVAPEPLNRYLLSSPAGHLGTSADVSPDLATTNLTISVESDHDSAPSPPTDMSIDKISTDSKAMVSVPSLSMLVPVNSKSMRADAAQRRIRRPFSVSEVETLVESVEKLGTGRWRDVKVRAFDTAKHRTYVDLKDKWKTLVHTARISPQQRRGEPVPQQLLDRVLVAHSHLTQPPIQHHLKSHRDTLLPSPLI